MPFLVFVLELASRATAITGLALWQCGLVRSRHDLARLAHRHVADRRVLRRGVDEDFVVATAHGTFTFMEDVMVPRIGVSERMGR